MEVNFILRIGKILLLSLVIMLTLSTVAMAENTNSHMQLTESAEIESYGKTLILDEGEIVSVSGEFMNLYYIQTEDEHVFFIPKAMLREYKTVETVEPIENKLEVRNMEDESSEKIKAVIDFAYAQLGKPYKYGAVGMSSFDCSGLTVTAYRQIGVSIPRVSRDQSNFGTLIAKQDMKAGDLVFFNTTGRGVSHVGMYVGNGEFIHASSSGRGVVVDSISDGYYAQRFVNARRIID